MKNGKVDELAFRKFVNWQIEQGSHGLVPVGTTGESPTLTPEEHKRVIEICIEEARGRVPVIAGTGSNSTMEAIEYTDHAQEAGADAALVVVPYYNKPTQDGLYAHFKAIADAVDIPIIVYNVPGRTVANISVETLARLVARLQEHHRHEGCLRRPDAARRASAWCPARTSSSFRARMAPRWASTPMAASAASRSPPMSPRASAPSSRRRRCAGDYAAALALQDRLMPLHHAMFVETSPGPVKYAASLLGLCEPEARLPMVPVVESTKKAVREAMIHAGLLN